MTGDSRRSDADVLDRACEILERDGWGKGFYTNTLDGTHCAIGAVKKATKELYASLLPGYRQAADRRIQRLLQARIELAQDCPCGRADCPGSMAVETWNDQPERTEAEVIELLKATAKDLRNEVAAV